MTRPMRDWQRMALPMQNNYLLRTDGGIVLAVLSRARSGSILWTWNSVVDAARRCDGTFVATELGDAQELVENALVHAGICRDRSYT